VTPDLRLSGFCARPDYVAGGRVPKLASGVHQPNRPHNNQSEASHLRRDSSVLQIGLVWDAPEVPGGSLARSASSFVFVLISA